MKKLIAILVVFAVVAGAAFAQDAGTWDISVSGRGGVLGVVDFDAGTTTGGLLSNPADDSWWNSNSLDLDVNYTFPGDLFKAGVSVGLGGVSTYLETTIGPVWAKISGDLRRSSYVEDAWWDDADSNGVIDNFEWYTGDWIDENDDGDIQVTEIHPLLHTMTGLDIFSANFATFEAKAEDTTDIGTYHFEVKGTIGSNNAGISKLWGSFSLFDDKLFFKGSYLDGGEEARWLINDAFFWTGTFDESITKVHGKNGYFLFNYDLKDLVEGLNAGLFVPGLFNSFNVPIEDTLGATVYGVSFETDGLGLAFQFYYPTVRLQASFLGIVDVDSIIDWENDFLLKLGAKISSGDIALGDETKLSASFKFWSDDTFDNTHLDADASFTYSPSPFEAGVAVEFGSTINSAGFDGGLAIKPYIQYDFDPDYLRGKLGVTFAIPFDGTAIGWSLKPELIYNFLGGTLDGSKFLTKNFDNGAVQMGMYLAYEVGGTFDGIGGHTLTAAMRWSF